MNLNNRGQSLVMFVLVLPVILFVLILVYDIGNAIVEKQKLNNINYLTIDYGLSNLSNNLLKDKLEEMITKNDNKIENIKIEIVNDELKITLTKNVEGIISHLVDIKVFEIKSTYKGTIKENKKEIERVK